MLLVIAPDPHIAAQVIIRHRLAGGQDVVPVYTGKRLDEISRLQEARHRSAPCCLIHDDCVPRAHRLHSDWRFLMDVTLAMLASGRLRVATDEDIAKASVPVHARKIEGFVSGAAR
jgi:hypothetical protein